MAEDRRVEKTKRALRLAMSELIEEKSYSEITVQNIVDRADVARSSFYAHFRDKDDLVLSGFREIGINATEDLFMGSDKWGGYPNFAIVLFRGAEQWKSMAKAFLSSDGATVASHYMRNMLVIQAREWLRASSANKVSALEQEAIVHYLANGLLGMMIWWVQNDFPCSAEELSETFNTLAVKGLQEFPHQIATEY